MKRPAFIQLLLFLSFISLLYGEDQTTIWCEAEQFESTGGRKNDPQFIDQMGSPYLLAVGIGIPVEDAATTIEVPVSIVLERHKRSCTR